jgi:hypothetical protein
MNFVQPEEPLKSVHGFRDWIVVLGLMDCTGLVNLSAWSISEILTELGNYWLFGFCCNIKLYLKSLKRSMITAAFSTISFISAAWNCVQAEYCSFSHLRIFVQKTVGE